MESIEQALLEFSVSGRRMKRDFDYMIKSVLQELQQLADANNGLITFDDARTIILQSINQHRRDIAKKYVVKLRDQKALLRALQQEQN